jgi:hypothetical protein
MPKIERKTAADTYTLRLKPEQMYKMKRISDKVGVPVPEQIRRGIDMWLKQQAAGR